MFINFRVRYAFNRSLNVFRTWEKSNYVRREKIPSGGKKLIVHIFMWPVEFTPQQVGQQFGLLLKGNTHCEKVAGCCHKLLHAR